jgi:hypothetical protein
MRAETAKENSNFKYSCRDGSAIWKTALRNVIRQLGFSERNFRNIQNMNYRLTWKTDRKKQ